MALPPAYFVCFIYVLHAYIHAYLVSTHPPSSHTLLQLSMCTSTIHPAFPVPPAPPSTPYLLIHPASISDGFHLFVLVICLHTTWSGVYPLAYASIHKSTVGLSVCPPMYFPPPIHHPSSICPSLIHPLTYPSTSTHPSMYLLIICPSIHP